MEAKNGTVVAKGAGGEWQVANHGYEISVMPDEHILELCSTAWHLQITILYCTRKNL